MKWIDLAAEHLERAPQDDGGGDAVDVVVAVDRDPLAARQRPLEPRHGPVHVGQQKRIVQVVERRVEEPIGDGRVAEAAQAQQAGDGRMDVQRRRRAPTASSSLHGRCCQRSDFIDGRRHEPCTPGVADVDERLPFPPHAPELVVAAGRAAPRR